MTTDNQRLCIEIIIPAAQRDDFVTILYDLGTIGLEEQDEGEDLLLKTFFSASHHTEKIAENIRTAAQNNHLTIQSLRVELFESDPQDWVEEYRKNFRGFAIGETFYVHPSWEEASQRHPVNLLIDPGHAFGTGTHESTQLCLLALRRTITKASSLLDVGTGSGILSIAARKLSRKLQIVALDVDPQAIHMAKENCRKNQIDDIHFFTGETSALKMRVDVVVANLTMELLVRLARDLAHLAKKELIVSGFTEEQSERVMETFNEIRPFLLRKHGCKNGWTCFNLCTESS